MKAFSRALLGAVAQLRHAEPSGTRAGPYPLLLRVAVRARICRLHFLLHSHSPQAYVFIPPHLHAHTLGYAPLYFPPPGWAPPTTVGAASEENLCVSISAWPPQARG